MNQTIKTGVGLAIIIIFGITVGAFTWYIMNGDQSFQSAAPTVPVVPPAGKNVTQGGPAKMCTQEAKICPDGTTVGRTGPNCEFAPCSGTTKKSGSEVTSIDNEWNMYTNHELSFSLLIPKKTGINLDDNNNVTLLDDTAIIEEGDIVFITSKEQPDYSENVQQIKSSQTEYEKTSGLHWAILVKNAKNDGELEKFIQNRFGNKCKLGTKSETDIKNLYKVGIVSGGPESDCFINYAYEIRYDSDKGKVAAWDLGQSRSLFITNIGDKTENMMSKSFQFID